MTSTTWVVGSAFKLPNMVSRDLGCMVLGMPVVACSGAVGISAGGAKIQLRVMTNLHVPWDPGHGSIAFKRWNLH
ncbi:hypothetical protein BJX65DRAFT_280431 [Aspergillus insuetus]